MQSRDEIFDDADPPLEEKGPKVVHLPLRGGMVGIDGLVEKLFGFDMGLMGHGLSDSLCWRRFFGFVTTVNPRPARASQHVPRHGGEIVARPKITAQTAANL